MVGDESLPITNVSLLEFNKATSVILDVQFEQVGFWDVLNLVSGKLTKKFISCISVALTTLIVTPMVPPVYVTSVPKELKDYVYVVTSSYLVWLMVKVNPVFKSFIELNSLV